MPAVSVIIPTFNRAHLIQQTLDSVLNQSFRDFEVIVVDDGSTDHTRDVVSQYPVKYVYQSNQGPPNARNMGIKTAEGRYLAILDSDDCMLKQSLEKRVAMLDRFPEIAFVYGQVYLMDDSGNITGLAQPPFQQSGIRDGKTEIHDLLYANHIAASSVMIRKSCLDKVGLFNPAFIHGQEDLELWVRLCMVFNSGYLAEPLIKLRIHSRRITEQTDLVWFEMNHHWIIESVFSHPVLKQLFKAEEAKIYSRLYTFMADSAYTRSARTAIRSYILKAFRMYPRDLFSPVGWKWGYWLLFSLTPNFLIRLARRFKRQIKALSSSPPVYNPPGE